MPTKDVNKLLKGVNDCVLAAVDDAGAASPAQCGDTFPLLSCGFLEENAIQSESKKLTQKAHGGELLQLGEIATVNINSLSGAGIGITAAKKFKNAQCNIYGFGSQQSHKLTRFLMNVETPHDLKKGGKSVIQFSTEKKISPEETLGTLGSSPTAFAADAAARYRDFVNNIRQENLVFAFIPYLGNFGQTTKAYDASDNRVVGSLLNGPTWGAAPDGVNSKLTFDGVNDYADFGDILDDDGASDLLLECWVNVLSDIGAQTILAKKNGTGSSGVGFILYRDGNGRVYCDIYDGTNSASVSTSANVNIASGWTYLSLTMDRNGNLTIYRNTTGEGTSAMSSVASVANSNAFRLGNTGYISIGAVRVYNFGAGGLPSNIATIISNHYNAEKSIFGL